ncbi:hypothetical protein ES703_16169 [subsurface metagenome]
MPEDKFCPFQQFSNPLLDVICKQSECQLWSEETQMCSISLGMNAILSVSDALRGISTELKDNPPD